MGHGFDESGLPASGGALQQHGQPTGRGGPKDFHLITDTAVKRLPGMTFDRWAMVVGQHL
jgi:hypothetical protein